jgi:two-component system, OmpR family, response regulator
MALDVLPPPGLMTRILIVDEDAGVSTGLRDHLQDHGFWVEVDLKPQVADRWRAGFLSGYAIIILDVMRSSMDGFELLRQIRDHSAVPVFVLTTRGEEFDCIRGLELGADEYVVKPCSPPEVLARVRALLRRLQPTAPQADVLTAGELTTWSAQRYVEWLGEVLSLTNTEYRLLEVLWRNAGRPVSKSDLSLQVLARPSAGVDRSINVHVSTIRRKLGRLTSGRPLIQVVNFNGYVLIKK